MRRSRYAIYAALALREMNMRRAGVRYSSVPIRTEWPLGDLGLDAGSPDDLVNGMLIRLLHTGARS